MATLSKRARRSTIIGSTAVVLLIIGATVEFVLRPHLAQTMKLIVIGLASLLAATGFTFSLRTLLTNAEYRLAMLSARRAAVEAREDELSSGGTGTDFITLWTLNQQRIGLYHDTALEQSQRSFRNSQYAMGVGLITVILTIVAAAFSRNGSGAIAAAVIGSVGTAASGYIGATFVRSQSEATAQFRQFFAQPVENARLLGAERLLDLIDDPKIKADTIAYLVRSNMMITRVQSAQEAAESGK